MGFDIIHGIQPSSGLNYIYILYGLVSLKKALYGSKSKQL